MCEALSQRSDPNSVGWTPFERWTNHYDRWFDSEKGEKIFQVEAACMRYLLKGIVSGAGFVCMRFTANKQKGRNDDS